MISVYCRYWFINRTGHRLLFRETTLQNFGKGKLAAGQGIEFGEISDVSSCHRRNEHRISFGCKNTSRARQAIYVFL